MFLALVTLALVAAALWRFSLGYPRPPTPFRHIAPREAAFLDAAAEATFPEGGAIPMAGRDCGLPRYVDRYFDHLHPAKRLQMRLLFALMEHATLLFPAPGANGWRRFSSLSAEQRAAALRGWADSGLFVRRIVFMALRAVVTMGYLGNPATLRHLGLAPLDFETPVVEADLLYPPIGKGPSDIRRGPADLGGPEPSPLDPHGPPHPDYAETPL